MSLVVLTKYVFCKLACNSSTDNKLLLANKLLRSTVTHDNHAYAEQLGQNATWVGTLGPMCEIGTFAVKPGRMVSLVIEVVSPARFN